MGFIKYQRTEASNLVSKQGHLAIDTELKKLGKKSLAELDEVERARIAKSLDVTPRTI